MSYWCNSCHSNPCICNKWCSSCRSYSCSCHNTCNKCHNRNCTCQCKDQVKGSCVFYQGANLSCIEATKGDTYDDILSDINDIICDLETPSGIFTTLTTCSDSIGITLTTPSGIPNYRICLDPALKIQINENTNNILSIQGCLVDNFQDVVSNTITITQESTSACGRTLRLETTSPTATTYDGIVVNDGSGTSSSGTGVQILYTFNRNYVSLNSITNGDEIRFAFEGAVISTLVPPGSITFEIFDANSATILYSVTESALPKNASPYGYEITGSIRRISASATYVSSHFNVHSQPLGTVGNFFSQNGEIRKSLGTVDYTNLSLRIKVNILDASATISCVTQMAEVRKKI